MVNELRDGEAGAETGLPARLAAPPVEEKRMDEAQKGIQQKDVQEIVQAVIQEFVKAEQTKAEPEYKVELTEERKRRESLEQRVNDLVAENQRTRAAAEEAERNASIRAELQKLGVAKVELAFKAVKDEIHRADDGRLLAPGGLEVRDYLAQFVGENPELLPARLAGGSGASGGQRGSQSAEAVDLDRIRPGMSAEEKERVRQEIVRVATQTLRGK
jgi:hypothetical protein